MDVRAFSTYHFLPEVLSMKSGPRHRYSNDSAVRSKIHPLKRVMALLAAFLPRSRRFFWLGLPPRAASEASNQAQNGEPITRLAQGIACHLGAHLDSKGAYVPELTLGAGRFIETRFVQKQRVFPRIKSMRGTVLSLALEGHVNYYRWLMETLPRLRFIRESGITYDYIYCCQQEPFHRRSLELLGCDLSRVIASEEHTFARGCELFVPRFIDETESWIIPWLREQFLPLVRKRANQSFPKRIFITRQQASGRRVANLEELLEKLAPLGFIVVALENYDWLDQLALFQNAEAIIGPHGAGLANLVFSSSPALVLEFIAEDYPFTFYPEISRQLHLRHHLIYGTPTNPERINNSDLRVDAKGVAELAMRALAA